MQAEIEAALGKRVREIAVVMQKATGGFPVAPKVEHSNDGSRHHFSIAHLALPIFVMVKGFQKVVTQAISCYNLGVNVVSWFCFGFVTFNFTRRHMDFIIYPR